MQDTRETDETIYLRFLSSREEGALKTLLERHRDGLTFFLYGLVHNMEDAEDLMIDAFAEAAARKSWSPQGSSFKTWLFAVGRKKALMHLRKHHRMQVFSLQDNAAERPGIGKETDLPESELLREERNRQLYQAMQSLPPDYRQVLTLLYFEQMSHQEAASVMGKSRKQIYLLANRGRERLGKILKETGFDHAQYR